MHLLIRYGGIVVLDRVLEPGEYTLGRGKDNKLRLHLSMLSRHHGKVYFEGGAWWYQDVRPSVQSGRTRLDPTTVVPLGNNVELLHADGSEQEATKQDQLSDIRAAMRVAHGGMPLGSKLAIAAGVLVVAGGIAGGWLWNKSRQPMDANELLQFARTKIVEFELPKQTKGQDDFRKYAGLKDDDFTDVLGFCTGFIVAPNVVLTANHCLQGGLPFGAYGQFTVKTHDGKSHQPETVLGFDVKRDYAFIEVPGLDAYGHLAIRDDFTVGEKVYTIGNVAGEGLAIRDGIMASKTPDQDDPSVEFLRYSAAASPGNSGGPLLDGFGKVQALVFARNSLSENYNLGTAGKDLVAAKKAFVDDRVEKEVAIRIKDMMQFRPDSLLYYLRIPYQDQWRENPESLRPLEAIETKVKVPAPLAAFTTAVVAAVNDATLKAYEQVQGDAANQKKGGTGTWDDFVTEKNRIIVPAGLDEAWYEVNLVDGGRQIKPTGGLLQPPCACSWMRTGEEDEEDTKPIEAYAISTRAAAEGKDNDEELVYTSDPDATKRPLSMLAYRPLVSVRSRIQAEGGDWSKARGFDRKTILKSITGKEGLLASTESTYVRPKSQREFSIKELDEELKEEELTDGLGRTWKVYGFELFDTYAVETYCLPLPQAGMCLTSLSSIINPELQKIARQNFARFSLTPYLVQPSFWTVDALVDFGGKGLSQQDPMMRDFKVTRAPNGDLTVELQTLGVSFTHKGDKPPTMLRLSGGLYLKDGKKQWVAVGHQAFFADGKDKKICDAGVEVKGTNSVKMLDSWRRRELYMKQLTKKDTKTKAADVELPADHFFTTTVSNSKAQTPLTVYGYCVPLAAADEDKGLYDLNFMALKPFKPAYKTF